MRSTVSSLFRAGPPLVFRAAERGLLIMLDNHRITANGGISPLWYNDEYPEDTVIGLWKALIDRYSGRFEIRALFQI